MVKYNYSKLKGRIKELDMTLNGFAERLGIAEQTLYKKFNNQTYFTQEEIDKAMKIIMQPMSKVQLYFLIKKLRKTKLIKSWSTKKQKQIIRKDFL